jgi:hypothetical protein
MRNTTTKIVNFLNISLNQMIFTIKKKILDLVHVALAYKVKSQNFSTPTPL